MDNLNFGARARRQTARRRRRRSAAIVAWALSTALGPLSLVAEGADEVLPGPAVAAASAGPPLVLDGRRATRRGARSEWTLKRTAAVPRPRRLEAPRVPGLVRRPSRLQRPKRLEAPTPAPDRKRPRKPDSHARDPEPVVDYTGSIEDIIYSAAAEFGLDGDYLYSVAWCESDLDPSAVSPFGYYGLFQFDEQTWADYGYGSIWDPVAQARTAARLLSAGEDDRWPNCA